MTKGENTFAEMFANMFGDESGSMPDRRRMGTQDHDGLFDLFGGFSLGGRPRDTTFSENAVVLAKLLESTALSHAIHHQTTFTESFIGVDMALDAMEKLTAYAMEVTNLPVSALNKEREVLGHNNTLRVVARLRENYNVEWLEAYLRMASMRLGCGKANRADKLLMAGIYARITKGKIAVPVVKMLGIPVKDWPLEGLAALYALHQALPQADDLPDEFDGEETIQNFLETLTQEGLRVVLTEHRDELTSLYLLLTDGDEDNADHNVRMLQKAYGIADKLNDDTEESFDPSKVDISRLDVLFGGDLPAH